MAGSFAHNDGLEDENKPERFPNSRRGSRGKKKKGTGSGAERQSPTRSGHNIDEGNAQDASSSFGAGFGTGLGHKSGKQFGGGRQVDAGYGGEQYAGGNFNQSAGDPYGKPQRSDHNGSSGSGTQYSAEKGKSDSPDDAADPGKDNKI